MNKSMVYSIHILAQNSSTWFACMIITYTSKKVSSRDS